ncbi:MAG: DUF1566 domain-containing protein [bacterium]|nr:DUF1566 domain-containing protein [bacterium]
MNSTRTTIVACALLSVFLLFGGCHPKALYEDAPRPPIELGRDYEQDRRYARAEAEYQQIDDVTVRNMTLNQLATAWDGTNADIIRAQQVVTADPQKATARLDLAKAFYHKALLCTRYTREAQGGYPRDFLFGEQDYFYTQSLRQAKTAIRLEPNLQEAYLQIGEIYLATSLHDEALKELKRLIIKHPNYARGYYAIGKIYFETGQYDKVQRYMVRSIKLDPDFLDAYYMLGQYFLEIDWYDYAAKTFLEILRKNPADSPSFDRLVEASHELGNFYVEQGAYDQGIRLFQEILLVRSSYDVHQSLQHAKQLRAEAPPLLEATAGQTDSVPVESSPSADEPSIEPVLPEDRGVEPEALPPLPEDPGNMSIAVAVQDPLVPLEFRKAPAALSNRDIIDMIQRFGFHHPNNLSSWGLSGIVKGNIQHGYELQAGNDGIAIVDRATGLTWQQNGSSEAMSWSDAKSYIAQLNQSNYAGYSDWRLPNVEELASLLEFEKKNRGNYIDPIFDATQGLCWTSDTVESSNAAWAVTFNSGHVYHDALDKGNYVRAVR